MKRLFILFENAAITDTTQEIWYTSKRQTKHDGEIQETFLGGMNINFNGANYVQVEPGCLILM